MIREAPAVLAVSSTSALWLTAVGIVVVVVLLTAFILGSRRAARRQVSAPATPESVARARREVADAAHRGDGWSTPDDDPEQGHPHR